MGQSLDFIKDRAVKSLSAARQVAPVWTWQEKSIAQMETALVIIVGDDDATPLQVGQEAIVSRAEQAMKAARATWDEPLDVLHRWTVQGLGMARTRFRNEPAKLSQLEGLSANSNSRSETLAEALAWESAWASLDPDWAPMPANSLPAFKALRARCNDKLQTDYANARSEWRKQSSKLAEMGRTLEDISMAWYADALRALPVGTPEGDMIRSTIPTTYNAPNAPAPAPAPAPPAPVS